MKKIDTKGIKPALTFAGTPLYRAEQAGRMLRPPVSERRMRKLAETYGVGRVFGRTLFFTVEDVGEIHRRRDVARRRKATRSA